MDCDDATRVARLQARGPEGFERTAGELHAYTAWADWMRRHAADPAWRPDVIQHAATDSQMRWSRWSSWHADDPRVHVIDTSLLPVDEVVSDLAQSIAEERALVRSGTHPLMGLIVDD
jgi:hypothetical protein